MISLGKNLFTPQSDISSQFSQISRIAAIILSFVYFHSCPRFEVRLPNKGQSVYFHLFSDKLYKTKTTHCSPQIKYKEPCFAEPDLPRCKEVYKTESAFLEQYPTNSILEMHSSLSLSLYSPQSNHPHLQSQNLKKTLKSS